MSCTHITFTAASIFRLPDEILLVIFKYTQYNGDQRNRNWFFVSHVCYLWREVALSSSFLWTFIAPLDFSTHELDEYLHRSKSNLLVVEFSGRVENFKLPDMPWKLFRVFEQLPRIKSLTGMMFHVINWGMFGYRFSQGAPLLEELDIWDMNYNLMLRIPDDLFGSHPASSLKTLTLRNVWFDAHAHLSWSNLSSLSLQFQTTRARMEVEKQLFVDDILDILKNCEALQELNMDLSSDWILSPNFQTRTIYLPNLRVFQLEGCDVPTSFALLNILVFPNLVRNFIMMVLILVVDIITIVFNSDQ